MQNEIKKRRNRKMIIATSIVSLIGLIAVIIYFLPENGGSKSFSSTFQYGEEKKQDLNIYLANEEDSTQKQPVILYAHGGGWTAGDKSNVAEKPNYFNGMGYHFISMNYRLSPKVTYKEQAEDVAAALKWVIDHAEDYNFDTEKISLMGHSAGGHLMMLAATDDEYLKEFGLSKKNIHTLINIEGPLDISNFITNFSNFEKVYGTDKNNWIAASPSHFIENNEQPPTLIITHLDEVTDQFMRDSKEAGNAVELFAANKLSHSELTKMIGKESPAEAKAMTEKLTTFMQKYDR